MWNLTSTPPVIVEAEVFARLPAEFAVPRRSEWADANKFGHEVASFLEGPSFDREGNLYVTDIPFGRIFRIMPTGTWSLVAQYDGWPNGIAIHRDGRLFIADYRRGLLCMDPVNGRVDTLLGHRNSESFRGLNDLTFDGAGRLYFTDQGQTGLHDPSGRVYRLDTDGRLACLLANGPSPNGIALDAEERTLFIAMTRANQVWRSPLMGDGNLSKVGAFRTFFGTSGPDGMAVDTAGNLVVAHASLGGAFVVNRRGEVTHFVRSPTGSTVTNVAFVPGASTLVLTESETGCVLRATLEAPGKPLFSHA
jgi:gluconolactonase